MDWTPTRPCRSKSGIDIRTLRDYVELDDAVFNKYVAPFLDVAVFNKYAAPFLAKCSKRVFAALVRYSDIEALGVDSHTFLTDVLSNISEFVIFKLVADAKIKGFNRGTPLLAGICLSIATAATMDPTCDPTMTSPTPTT